jgi:hypothetical protein
LIVVLITVGELASSGEANNNTVTSTNANGDNRATAECALLSAQIIRILTN